MTHPISTQMVRSPRPRLVTRAPDKKARSRNVIQTSTPTPRVQAVGIRRMMWLRHLGRVGVEDDAEHRHTIELFEGGLHLSLGCHALPDDHGDGVGLARPASALRWRRAAPAGRAPRGRSGGPGPRSTVVSSAPAAKTGCSSMVDSPAGRIESAGLPVGTSTSWSDAVPRRTSASPWATVDLGAPPGRCPPVQIDEAHVLAGVVRQHERQ